jgi:hypothetical protein
MAGILIFILIMKQIKKYKKKIFWIEPLLLNFLNNDLLNFFLTNKQNLFIFKFPKNFQNLKKNLKFKSKFNFGYIIFFKFNFSIFYLKNSKYELNVNFNQISMNLMSILKNHKIFLFIGNINFIFCLFPMLI